MAAPLARSLVQAFLAMSACFIAGCSGGGGAASSATPVDPPTPAWSRGTLVQSPPIHTDTFTASTLQQRLNDGGSRNQALLSLAGDPLCGVDVQALQYTTLGGLDEQTTASGVLMVPTGSAPSCTGARPIVVYAHATNPAKAYNLAATTVSDNPANYESFMLAAFFAGQGYIVVAPNYAGYDTSTLGYHPFLIADQQSKDMVDALTAAKKALALSAAQSASAVTASNKLFLTGYSQGGFVALATQRAMEQLGTTITAAAPLSGPYALAAQTDDLFRGNVYYGSPLFGPMLVTAYQKVYGTLYKTTTDFYDPAYASGMETLLPGTSASELVSTGKLPEYAFFSSTIAQAPANATALQTLLNTSTPPTGTSFDTLFAKGFGSSALISNTARVAYLQDALQNPDGARASQGDGLPAAAPQYPLRIATKRNDLRGFSPKAPVLLCGGGNDPSISFRTNSEAMASLWAGLPSGRVTLLDIDSNPSSFSDPYRTEKLSFGLVKNAILLNAQLAGKNTDIEMAINYHVSVAPFCLSAAKRYFSGF